MANSTRKRTRNEQSHQAILKAVWELLEEKGYVGLTIEGIAARAGVGKQTIYRWWKSKAELCIEVYAQRASQKIPVANTGKVSKDLEMFLGTIFGLVSKAPSSTVMTGIMAEAQVNAEIAESFYSNFIQNRRECIMEILTRGIERGEIDASVDVDVVVDCLFGAMWYRLLLNHGPLDKAFALKLVQQVLQGVVLSPEKST